MRYFTSDWHLGDNRLRIWGRHMFAETSDRVDRIIQDRLFSVFKDGDELIHLGDVVYDAGMASELFLSGLRERFPNSRFTYIEGNYDEGSIKEAFLHKYGWKCLGKDACIRIENVEKNVDITIQLNHYPMNVNTNYPVMVCGHIHGAWRFQRIQGVNVINVGVDAWNFCPVSEEDLVFYINACANHYDHHVFPHSYGFK